MIDAVVFDLDDTLFLQEQWLDGAWSAVARCASECGADGRELDLALRRIAAEGTAAGGIIDRALIETGQEQLPVGPLVDAFRGHRADRLQPLAGVEAGLERLRRHVPVGLVSDGDVSIQKGKLDALGIGHAFDVIIWSDALGRSCRKPDPAPFRAALDQLGTTPDRTVYVGDNPAKDVAGADGVGMRAVRVLTGEYASRPGPDAWMEVADAAAAMAALSDRIEGQVGVTA